MDQSLSSSGSMFWNIIPWLSSSETQRFSQLLLIHRVCKSPAMLYRIAVRTDSQCPRCSLDNVHIMHGWLLTQRPVFWASLMIYTLIPWSPLASPVCYSRPGNWWPFIGSNPPHLPSESILLDWITLIDVIRLEKEVYVKQRSAWRFKGYMGPMARYNWPTIPSLFVGSYAQDSPLTASSYFLYPKHNGSNAPEVCCSNVWFEFLIPRL